MTSDAKRQPAEELFFIDATIDCFEGRMAVIKTSDGQEILWSIEKLPEVTEGDVVKLSIVTQNSETDNKTEIAKALLREILKNNNEI